MNLSKDNPLFYDINIELKTLETLSDIVKTLKTSDDFAYGLAQVSINSNISEYLLDLLLRSLFDKTSLVIKEQKLKFDIDNFKTEGMSIRQRIETLNLFNFPHKKEVVELFGIIKTERDNILHKLITAHRKNIDIDKSIKMVRQKTDEFRLLIAQVISEVLPI